MKKLNTLFLIAVSVCVAGCNADKTYAGAGTVTALKVESTGSMSTGTLLPNLLLGGAAYAGVGQPNIDNKPTLLFAQRKSVWAEIFNLSAGDTAMIYIGGKEETSEETIKRFEAFKGLVEGKSDEVDKSDKQDTRKKTKREGENKCINLRLMNC